MLQKLVEHINPHWIIFIGGLLTLIGTYLAYLKDKIETRENDEKISNIQMLSQQNHDLTNTINQQQIEISEQQIKLSEKQSQIENLQNKNYQLSQSISLNAIEINSLLTSKDSYIYFIPNINSYHNGMVNLRFIGGGKYPLQVLSMYIFDLTLKQEIYKGAVNIQAIPNVTSILPVQIPVNITKPLKWNIFFMTLQGEYCEQLKCIITNDKKLFYSVIVSGPDGKELYRYESEYFEDFE